MIATCKHKCQFRGRSVKPGEVFAITTQEINDLVKNSFTITDYAPVVQTAPEAPQGPTAPSTPPDNVDLTISELKRRLATMGVPFKARDTLDTLKALYNQAHQPQEIK